MPPRVLVVDDEHGLRSVLEDLLDMEGFAVRSCGDRISAMAELESGEFDVALLDVFLSNRPEGLALAGHILAEKPRTRVILMTGFADAADVEQACLSGVFACIAKPFSLDDVLRTVGLAMEVRDS